MTILPWVGKMSTGNEMVLATAISEEKAGRLKMHDLKMQDWKMTDNILANSEKNYGVWKMQDWKMTDKILANSGQNYGARKMQDWKRTDHVN